MGHFCWMCERERPNEAFSGRNHGRHLCRDCARLPKSERDRKDRLSALFDVLLCQSNISKGNIQSALAWADDDPELGALASLVVEIGHIHPRRKKRMPYLRRNHPELWQRMILAGVVEERVDRIGLWGDDAWHIGEMDDPGNSEAEPDEEDVPF